MSIPYPVRSTWSNSRICAGRLPVAGVWRHPVQSCRKVTTPTHCWARPTLTRCNCSPASPGLESCIHQTWNWATFCDPVTRESSDPDTQLTRWPCSIMNSRCRLMLQTNVCNGQEVCQFYRCLAFARFCKVKFWRSFIKCQYFNDGWTDFHKNIYLYLEFFFRKPEKLGSHTGSKWRLGDPVTRTERWPKWPIDPVTQWPSSMSDTNWTAVQSCPWVHFVLPDPTQPISWLTQPNPTHYQWKNLDPTRPNPIQLHINCN